MCGVWFLVCRVTLCASMVFAFHELGFFYSIHGPKLSIHQSRRFAAISGYRVRESILVFLFLQTTEVAVAFFSTSVEFPQLFIAEKAQN